MRKLLYVPVIHSSSDLGSMAAAIVTESAHLCGEERWHQHQETLRQFWQRVADYLMSHDVASLKVYQDGLAADGELGRRTVAEAARRGSENHRLILELIKRGAELRKTEDPALLVREYESLSRIIGGEQIEAKTSNGFSYEVCRDKLSKERDSFVANNINETLRDGETAVLFMGADHNVAPYLARDVAVEQAKDVGKVRAYIRALFYRRDERKFQQLARYLAAPLSAPGS